MGQQHLRSLSKKGSVINTTLANATAKVLIIKYPNVAGDIGVDSSRWYVRRRKTSSKVDIPEKARKESSCFCTKLSRE